LRGKAMVDCFEMLFDKVNSCNLTAGLFSFFWAEVQEKMKIITTKRIHIFFVTTQH